MCIGHAQFTNCVHVRPATDSRGHSPGFGVHRLATGHPNIEEAKSADNGLFDDWPPNVVWLRCLTVRAVIDHACSAPRGLRRDDAVRRAIFGGDRGELRRRHRLQGSGGQDPFLE